jgi:hypothetical protein
MLKYNLIDCFGFVMFKKNLANIGILDYTSQSWLSAMNQDIAVTNSGHSWGEMSRSLNRAMIITVNLS